MTSAQRAASTAHQVRVLRRFAPVRRGRLPRQLPPKAIERDYAARLVALTDRMRPALEQVLAALPHALAEVARARGDAWRSDAPSDRLRGLLGTMAEQLARAAHPAGTEALAREFAVKTATYQRIQLQRQVRAALGADVLGSEAGVDAALDAFVHANVALIKDIPAKVAAAIEQMVTRAAAASTPHPQLADELRARFEALGPSRAKLIARDQIGKAYGAVNQIRQRNLGVEGYLWRGVLDRRERPEHVDREGVRFTWDDPPPDGHPGEPVLCRCSAEPDFSGILGEL